ncbi:MAG: rubrerythrin family protein [Dehalococcoidia bacterium]|nr:rubrerythrin family protein [Dehalococcoidia bacterium]
MPKVAGEKARYQEYLASELEGAGLFQTLANVEPDPERSELFRDLAANEIKHATRWAEKLGVPIVSLRPTYTLRTKILGRLAKRFGLKAIAPLLVGEEVKEFDKYHDDPAAQGLDTEERRAARVLGISNSAASVQRRERWHKTGGGGSLRAAVLGVNDGLVSNFSLTMGVAGGTEQPAFVLLAGVAGLLAGSLSMAAGEYVSMRAQRDLYEHQIRLERTEIEEMPEEETQELIAIYRAKGLSLQEADSIARRLMSEPEMAVSTKVMEEMGLSPTDRGSPWGAAISSFVAFAVGAIIPLLPYFFRSDTLAFVFSGALSAIALIIVGTLLAIISGNSLLRGALRMLLVGCLAAAVTYGVGKLLGVALK